MVNRLKYFLDQYHQASMVLEPSINELIVSDTQGQSISVTLKGSSQPVTAIAELASWFIVSLVFWITGYYVFRKKAKKSGCNFVVSVRVGIRFSFKRKPGCGKSDSLGKLY